VKLYYKAGACSLSPHIALSESGMAFTIEAVDLATKKTAGGDDFLKVNPKGYVPALALDGDAVLTENLAILLYVAARVPEKRLAPTAGTLEYARLIEWLTYIATELHKTAGLMFKPDTPEAAKVNAKALLARRLDYADKALGAGPYLMGEQFSVADGYLFTVLSWLPHLAMDAATWPNLAALAARVGARPAVQAALKAEGLLKR
jgi:glutathione S-transferase